MAITLDQRNYKFGADDNATADNCTFDAENTPRTSQAKSTTFMIRIQVANEGTATLSRAWQLYVNTTNDPATATKVTTSSSYVQLANGQPTHGAALSTNKCTAQAETWQAGEYADTGDTDKLQLGASYYTEFQFCIQLTTDATGPYYLFLRYNETACNQHTNVPAVTAAAGALSKSVADTVTITESRNPLIKVLLRAETQSATITESQNPLLPKLLQALTDSSAITDSASPRIVKLLLALADSSTVAEEILGVVPVIKAIEEAVAIGENIERFLPRLVQVLTEAITVGEAASQRIPKLLKSLADSIAIGESVQPILPKLLSALAQTATIGEAVTPRIPKLLELFVQYATIADTIQPRLPKLLTILADGVAVSDTASPLLLKIYQTLQESVSVLDIITTPSVLNRQVVETVTIAENCEAAVIGNEPVNCELTQAATVTDSCALSRRVLDCALTESVAMSESVTLVQGSLQCTMTQAITLSDAGFYALDLCLSMGQAVHVTEVRRYGLDPFCGNVAQRVYVKESIQGGTTVFDAIMYQPVWVSEYLNLRDPLRRESGLHISVNRIETAMLFRRNEIGGVTNAVLHVASVVEDGLD